MKRKLLTLGLLTLCSVTLVTPAADAWGGSATGSAPWCNLFRNPHRYTTQITVRPYNAFTPICWGNLVCDGCCPSPCGVASGCMPMQFGAPPWCYNYGPIGMPCYVGGACGPAGACGPGGCADGAYASDMTGMMPPNTAMPPTMLPAPSTVAPPTMPGHENVPELKLPFPNPTGYRPQPRAQAMPYGNVAQVNYNPNYYPAAYPYYPMPTPMAYYPSHPWQYTQQAPSYWYGYGR